MNLAEKLIKAHNLNNKRDEEALINLFKKESNGDFCFTKDGDYDFFMADGSQLSWDSGFGGEWVAFDAD